MPPPHTHKGRVAIVMDAPFPRKVTRALVDCAKTPPNCCAGGDKARAVLDTPPPCQAILETPPPHAITSPSPASLQAFPTKPSGCPSPKHKKAFNYNNHNNNFTPPHPPGLNIFSQLWHHRFLLPHKFSPHTHTPSYLVPQSRGKGEELQRAFAEPYILARKPAKKNIVFCFFKNNNNNK